MRRTIYVDDELDQQMKEAEEGCQQKLNWSEIAQDAFRAYLTNMKTETIQISDTASRLRASRVEYLASARECGFAAGSEWAKRYADYPALARIKSMRRSGGWNDVFRWNGDAIVLVLKLVNGRDDETYTTYDLADEAELDQFGDNREYAEAFLEGALDVFVKALPSL